MTSPAPVNDTKSPSNAGRDPATKTWGSGAVSSMGFVPGNIALVQRGTCAYVVKAANAQAAGASALILFNEGQSGRTAVPNNLPSGAQGVHIPGVGTPFAVGVDLETDEARVELSPAPDELVAAAREIDESQPVAMAFAAAARLLLAQGRANQAQALLEELDRAPGVRTDLYYASRLPELLRTALALGDAALAARLADGVAMRMPLVDHALVASRAQLAEAAGDHTLAVTLHSEAAERWREFGNVPERAYALLGLGRCLMALGETHAERSLRDARELFASMRYEPALADVDALLRRSEVARAQPAQ